MLFRSIRWQLQLWHGLILLMVLAGFGFSSHRLQQANELRRVDQELQSRLAALLEGLRRPAPPDRRGPLPPPRGEGTEPRAMRIPPNGPPIDLPEPPRDFRLPPQRMSLFDPEESNPFYYVVWRRDGYELGRSAQAPSDVSIPKSQAKTPLPQGRTRGVLRELFVFTRPGECLLVGRSIEPEIRSQRQLAWWLTGLGSTVLALGLAGGSWLANRAIRPINEISATSAKIAAGDLSQRISSDETESELGRLTGVLNSTFARLEAAFAQQGRFTADASHELRTPVSVILSQAQSTLARERSPAEYRESLEACQRAALRMRQLIESLLELARLDAGEEVMHRAQFDLGRTARECIDLVSPLARERGIQIHADLPAVDCEADEQRIGQVITNLVTNAIHFNSEHGEVHVSARSENGIALLSVSDTGQGIPAEDLPHLFERFYRVDKSRSRIQGRTGLGLAICKAIVDAHGGSIEVKSEPGRGTTFLLRLPGKSS